MGVLLAAAPFEDFVREHSPALFIVAALLVALLIIRIVVKTMTRFVLLGTVALFALFVTIERNNIAECTRTCECTIAGFDTSLPYCEPSRIATQST